jgi:hypothetical protein
MNLKRVAIIVCLSVAAVPYTAEVVIAGLNSGYGLPLGPFWSIDRASAQSKRLVTAVSHKANIEFDTRDRIELLAEYRGQGIDAVPAVMLGPLLSESGPADAIASGLMPLGGISNRRTVLCYESGQYVSYTSDEHGFRNPPGTWKSDRADMAVVGESFVQGYCVPDGLGFVDLLRSRYPATLNLGISGQSGLLQLAAIKEYLPRYAPRIVLWVYCEGIDLVDLYDESTHSLLMRYLEPTFTQHLTTRQDEIDQALQQYISETDRRDRDAQPAPTRSVIAARLEPIIKLWDLREKLRIAYGVNGDDEQIWSKVEQTASHHLLTETLTQAQAITRSWGGTLYFVYLPSWNRYRHGSMLPDRERSRVLNLVKGLGIPAVDAEPAFRTQDDPLSLFPFRRFGHYNGAGNRIVAETVLASLAVAERRLPATTTTNQLRDIR